jgi:hypothetical protein
MGTLMLSVEERDSRAFRLPLYRHMATRGAFSPRISSSPSPLIMTRYRGKMRLPGTAVQCGMPTV